MRIRLHRAKGYLTVFLSLSISILLALIMALFQLAGISAMRMRTESVADIAMNSVLAEYSKELRNRYGLLMVDTSYGTGTPGIANAEERLRYYVQGNFEKTGIGNLVGEVQYNGLHCDGIAMPEYSYATDGNGAVFRRQILEYMTAEPVEQAFADVADNVNLLESAGYTTRDVHAEQQANQEVIDSIELPTRINEEGEEEEVALNNPADAINGLRGSPILGMVVPEGNPVSGSSVNLSSYVSCRNRLQGTGLYDSESLSIADKLLIDQYIFEKCSNYRNRKADTRLAYEVEYILFGNNSDKENLEKVAKTLLFWREAANFGYIMTDGGKKAAASAAALALAAVTLNPEFYEPVKMSILFAWSFAESISDLRILFRGGRVPLVKSAATWKTGFLTMGNFGGNLSGGGSGLSYEDYLRMMLFMHGIGEKTFRLMDVMEMDIRMTAGNAGFRMDGCLDCFRGQVLVSGRYGFSMDIQRYYGYEWLP